MPDKRKILILINPISGRGLALRNWTKAKPMVDLGHLEVTLRHTEYQNHAQEIVRDQLKIGDYDGITTVSGDGLIFEIINGIM